MTATAHYAYATDLDQATANEYQPDEVLILEYTLDDSGRETYTGNNTSLPGATPDRSAMDDILWVGGWVRVAPWSTESGQHIARVIRRELRAPRR